MVAGIAVSAASYSIDKLYSYRIPENMTLQPGQRVQVPFGRGNVTAEGIVITVGTGGKAQGCGKLPGRGASAQRNPAASGGLSARAVLLHIL